MTTSIVRPVPGWVVLRLHFSGAYWFSLVKTVRNTRAEAIAAVNEEDAGYYQRAQRRGTMQVVRCEILASVPDGS